MKSHYIILGDKSWPVESVAKALPESADVRIWVDGNGWVSGAKKPGQSVRSRLPVRRDLAPEVAETAPLSGGSDTIFIVGFEEAAKTQSVVEVLKARDAGLKILQVGSSSTRSALTQKKRSVAWDDLVHSGLDCEIRLLQVLDRVRQFRALMKDVETVALLLQEDPDPDGLASALAVRKLLHRNAQTAPILSFGKITRPENVAMAKLLEIDVQPVTEADLARYDRVVMVDCQPSFFKGRNIPVHAILDHHPQAESWDGVWSVIREDLGATSTLLTQFLRVADVEFSTRLATALLYGIKSDTLMLNRQASDEDLEAFLFLYPQVNSSVLRRIERPDLPRAYLKVLARALPRMASFKNWVHLPLGKVEREEWIPQAADFALQTEGAEWAVASGEFEGQIVMSFRNCGYVEHCGDLVKAVFGGRGRAGGHRCMAKAILARRDYRELVVNGGHDPAIDLLKLLDRSL